MIYKDHQAATHSWYLFSGNVSWYKRALNTLLVHAFGCNGPEENHGEQKRAQPAKKSKFSFFVRGISFKS